ncbi:MAG: winged helix-turn-helix domain-containing protein [Pirellulaceae bacterium]|nr:winged helix-turn-helix domain-containing protein [Pirellulaceae bacterium]
MRSKGTAQDLESRRKRAIDLLKQGWTPQDVADAIGVSRQSIYNWRSKWHAGGKKALVAVPQHVPTCRMSVEQQRELRSIIMQGALVAGYQTDLWTTARIAAVVKKKFKIDYNPDHLGRLLHSLGYSCQKPIKQAREQDETAVKRWKTRDWLSIATKNRPVSQGGWGSVVVLRGGLSVMCGCLFRGFRSDFLPLRVGSWLDRFARSPMHCRPSRSENIGIHSSMYGC